MSQRTETQLEKAGEESTQTPTVRQLSHFNLSHYRPSSGPLFSLQLTRFIQIHCLWNKLKIDHIYMAAIFLWCHTQGGAAVVLLALVSWFVCFLFSWFLFYFGDCILVCYVLLSTSCLCLFLTLFLVVFIGLSEFLLWFVPSSFTVFVFVFSFCCLHFRFWDFSLISKLSLCSSLCLTFGSLFLKKLDPIKQ